MARTAGTFCVWYVLICIVEFRDLNAIWQAHEFALYDQPPSILDEVMEKIEKS